MSNMIKFSISYLIILNFCEIIKSDRVFSMVYRELWLATPTDQTIPFKSKLIPYVIVHESGGPTCKNFIECTARLQELQRNDFVIKKDIRYNFLIGGDGRVYEGRGWYRQGNSITEYDPISISIAFIGTFSGNIFVTKRAWICFKYFLSYGMEFKFLSEQYQLLGHRQFQIIWEPYALYQAECPGINIDELIRSLPHWRNLTIKIHR